MRSIAEQQEVPYLLHFTPVINLPGIVKHGLLSRDKLAERGIPYASYESRLDGREDATSVSISRVSRQIFDRKRHKGGHPNWVVLRLNIQVLCTHECLFAWRNAATNEIQYPFRERNRPWAFYKMFDGSNEERNGLGPWFPTDPEAEVQVLKPIAPDCILEAIVDRHELVEAVQGILNCMPGDQRPVAVDASWGRIARG